MSNLKPVAYKLAETSEDYPEGLMDADYYQKYIIGEAGDIPLYAIPEGYHITPIEPVSPDQIMRDNITTHNESLRDEHKGKCTAKCYMSPHMSMGMHKTNCYLAGLKIEEEFCMVCVGSGRSSMLGHSECGYCKGKGYTTEEDTRHLMKQVGAKDNADGWEGIQDAIKLMEEASVPSWSDVDYYQLGYLQAPLPICTDDQNAEYNQGAKDRQREKGDE